MRVCPGRRIGALVALALMTVALPAAASIDIDRTYSDATGDADSLAGTALDIVEARVMIDDSIVAFSGVLASPTGNFETLFGSGSVALPGNQARYLGMFYSLIIDADRDPSTGFFGAEYILEVTFNVIQQNGSDPPGDFSDGIALGDPVIGLLRSFTPTGAQSLTNLSSGFSRTADSFSVTAPRSSFDFGEEISVQVAALTFGTDGELCLNPLEEPTFCSFFSDFAPESPDVLMLVAPTTPGTVEFTDARFTARESDGTASVSVSYTPGTGSENASVNVAVVGGTADASDFSGPTPPTVNFSGGAETAEVLFNVVDDRTAERVETVELRLTSPDGALLGDQAETTLVLRDDDVEVSQESSVGGATARSPLVLYDPLGRKAVLWDQIVNGVRQICARIFDADGDPLTPVFLVDPRPGVDQVNPSAAFTRSGLAVVFEEVAAGSAGKANANLVGAFLADFIGNRAPVELPIEDLSVASSPQVAADRNGNIVVSWNEEGELFAQEFDESTTGSRRFTVGVAEINSPVETASSANGDYAVAWLEGSPFSASRVMVRRYSRGGRAQGAAMMVEEGPGLDAPSLAMAADGSFVIAYERATGGGTDVVAARYDRDGQRVVAPKVLSTSFGDNLNPSAALNSKGDLAVVWEENLGAALKGGQLNGNLVGNFFDPTLSPTTEVVEIAEPDGETGVPVEAEVSVDEDDETTVVYTRRRDDEPDQIFQTELTPSLSDGVCEPGDEKLCLQQERFGITVQWEDFQGNTGSGRAVPLTTDSGYLWFFSESNVEMVIKVLNGCPLNNRFWVFAGGLTNVEVTFTVDDSLTGASRTYANPLGTDFAPIQDTSALNACTDADSIVTQPELLTKASSLPICPNDAEALCLGPGNRFEVRMDWRTAQGTSGVGMPTGLTSDTGYFWFFDSSNVEVVIKVLDGCALTNHFWVFAGGLTDVETTMTVTDTLAGTSKTYRNRLGDPFQPILDTAALQTCDASRPERSGQEPVVPRFPGR
ncbi:MAG: Calx-beta domain-containing protein [Acidobacteriota bacterium]